MRLLFVTAEVYPLVKTGGLGDVSYSLAEQLCQQGHEVRLVVPHYSCVDDTDLSIEEGPLLYPPMLDEPVRMNIATLKNSKITFYLLECDNLYHSEGGPYVDNSGHPHANSVTRFSVLSWCAAALAAFGSLNDWRPDVIHIHDWQAGLVPVYLHQWRMQQIKVVLTIHNLQYLGRVDAADFPLLKLSNDYFSMDAMEYYGDVSMLKAAIVYADKVTTVSPTYAKEIQQPQFGCGLEGLLSHYQHKLVGILNGVDYQIWSPATDDNIAKKYTVDTLKHKTINKKALLKRFEMTTAKGPLIAMVTRLTEQKGVDLVLDCIESGLRHNAQFVILGSGDPQLEQSLLALAESYPDNVGVFIGYDEVLSHQIQAGADAFLMPSRFEPCGLTQLYALKYGTLPIVRRTGGLADSVWQQTDKPQTGFVFNQMTVKSLQVSILEACQTYKKRKAWQQIQINAMSQDFSWDKATKAYLALYQQLT
ncbi:glycogen synthase GlgA [Paraferrimonas sp. SM1919]|uniref:glycogen synthase GlgA n=1 Tax=Paraferrimonas sp. SM1919 TaxID=2662263 RepID=UPI0013D7C437|nr:glycogen synthase GlgA [Paraferrimonas sp. SM1919]